MKVNKWTLGLAAVGLVTLPSSGNAEEQLNPVQTALSSTTISGYVNASVHWNPGTGNDNVPGYAYSGAFNGGAKADGFNLDVVKLRIEKPLDESQWAAGYTVDLIFGPDANEFYSQVDFNDHVALKQAYIALRAPVGNGLDFKFGVFDTIIGYETFDSGNNPNYTRSYGYTIEPTTHTGLLMSYQFSEWLSGSFGIANSFGPDIGGSGDPNDRAHQPTQPAGGDKAESYKTYMGALAATAPEDWGYFGGSTLYAGVINGFNNSGPIGGADQTSWYIGLTMNTPIKGVKVGASYDYLGVSGQPLTTGLVTPGEEESGYMNATALYASFQATEKLTLHTRGEWFTQSKSAASVAYGTGLPSKVFAVTGTAQYDLWQNVVSRLEVRWDHQADGTGHAYGESKGTDSLGGSKRNNYLVAANIIYKF